MGAGKSYSMSPSSSQSSICGLPTFPEEVYKRVEAFDREALRAEKRASDFESRNTAEGYLCAAVLRDRALKEALGIRYKDFIEPYLKKISVLKPRISIPVAEDYAKAFEEIRASGEEDNIYMLLEVAREAATFYKTAGKMRTAEEWSEKAEALESQILDSAKEELSIENLGSYRTKAHPNVTLQHCARWHL